jgi:hypothetical protein
MYSHEVPEGEKGIERSEETNEQQIIETFSWLKKF